MNTGESETMFFEKGNRSAEVYTRVKDGKIGVMHKEYSIKAGGILWMDTPTFDSVDEAIRDALSWIGEKQP